MRQGAKTAESGSKDHPFDRMPDRDFSQPVFHLPDNRNQQPNLGNIDIPICTGLSSDLQKPDDGKQCYEIPDPPQRHDRLPTTSAKDNKANNRQENSRKADNWPRQTKHRMRIHHAQLRGDNRLQQIPCIRVRRVPDAIEKGNAIKRSEGRRRP